jgi:hypothetical protein
MNRIAVGPQSGCKMFTLQTLPACNPEDRQSGTLGEAIAFALHAKEATRVDERGKLDRRS